MATHYVHAGLSTIIICVVYKQTFHKSAFFLFWVVVLHVLSLLAVLGMDTILIHHRLRPTHC